MCLCSAASDRKRTQSVLGGTSCPWLWCSVLWWASGSRSTGSRAARGSVTRSRAGRRDQRSYRLWMAWNIPGKKKENPKNSWQWVNKGFWVHSEELSGWPCRRSTRGATVSWEQRCSSPGWRGHSRHIWGQTCQSSLFCSTPFHPSHGSLTVNEKVSFGMKQPISAQQPCLLCYPVITLTQISLISVWYCTFCSKKGSALRTEEVFWMPCLV